MQTHLLAAGAGADLTYGFAAVVGAAAAGLAAAAGVAAGAAPGIVTSLNGNLSSSSLRMKCFLLFLVI